MRAFFVILFAIFATACSKADVHKTTDDMKAAADDIRKDPAVKRTEADLRSAAKDTGKEVRKGAAKAQAQLRKAGTDIKKSGQDATDASRQKSDS
jgi:hypothetical protein